MPCTCSNSNDPARGRISEEGHPMRITILGTGQVGITLAGGLIRAGHDVVFGSRTPDAKELPAPALEPAAAIDGADLVVSALQASVSLEVLPTLADALDGTVLIDLGNAVTPAFELMYPNSSLGEKLQQALPRTRVVKSLNSLALVTAVDPGALASTSNVFLSGDDESAKQLVSGVLADLGWAPAQQIDLGGIATAKGPEHWFVLYAILMMQRGPSFNIGIIPAA
ncbi:oxidoreductase [Schumannella soli]|uniref:Oxidoreductase n=2 Tax=Schumannella soli TaxID=2590779 RepID=A0A506Y9D7_9MICO|nr:oxidoreductase [Schumannella soli]